MFRIFLVLFIFPFLVNGQTVGVRGHVLDMNGRPVQAATVELYNDSTRLITNTDSAGIYSFTDVRTGRYIIVSRHPEFASDSIIGVSYQGGKQLLFDLQFRQRKIELEQVNFISVFEHEYFSVEEGRRFAASYNDPGRLAMSSPSVFATDDQANHVTVRGMHPFQNKWFLEGTEILNPNHLENAGTLSDRPGAAGGGVNIFSSLILSDSRFLKGILPASFQNCTGGTFDIGLRNGNDVEREYTAQLSLLGLETSLEGPIDSGKASYLFNVRYSTVGVLSAIGVDFGGERINYYDLSGVFNFKIGNGNLKFFMITGRSINEHEVISDTADAVSEKDFKKIEYDSYTSIVGLNLKKPVAKRTSLFLSTAFSNKLIEREEINYYQGFDPSFEFRKDRMLSYSAFLKNTFKDNTLSYGVSGNVLMTDVFVVPEHQSSVVAPFASFKWVPSNRFAAELVVNGFISDRNSSIDPRLNVSMPVSNSAMWTFNAGRRSQEIIQSQGDVAPLNVFINSSDAELSYIRNIGTWRIRNTGYAQYANLNFNVAGSVELLPEKIKSVGYELMLTIKLIRKYYLQLAGTVFKAEEEYEKVEIDGLFDHQYGLNLNLGKEIKLKKRILNLDYRFHLHGGGNQIPLATQAALRVKLPYYYRHDIRIALSRSTRRNSLLFLDIQNITSRKNVSGYYYDPYLRRVIAKEQLGVIPVLGYKIDF